MAFSILKFCIILPINIADEKDSSSEATRKENYFQGIVSDAKAIYFV